MKASPRKWQSQCIDIALQHYTTTVLAEPTLKRFSQRIADDLPDDLAVVCAVGAFASEACSTEGEFDRAMQGDLREPFSSAPTAAAQKFLPPADLAAVTYQVSFSKNYRMRPGIPSCVTKPVATYAAAAPQSHSPAASAGA